MFRLTRLLVLIAIGFALPFTASALSIDSATDADLRAWQAGAEDALALPPGVEPPECGLERAGDGTEQADAQPTACCWVFYFGRWWCVPC